ncbi:MAG: MBL fold metallo-hydrolase, partial [Acidobacteriota bacterium]
MSFLRVFLVCAATLWAAAAPPLIAQDAAEAPTVTFKSTELTSSLYMLENVGGFGGGNVGLLIGEDGVIMVDDSFPPHTEQLLAAVASVVEDPVDFVINTHVHGDHSGGNAELHGQGAIIVAHDNVRVRLKAQGVPGDAGGERKPTPPEMLPVLTFADAVRFHLNGEESFVFHVEEAHTDGDSVIHFKTSNVIHAGDVFLNGILPFNDHDNGGSVDGYIAAQEQILSHTDGSTRIIPGHGPLATPQDLEKSVAMLKDARHKISELMVEGRSIDEIIAAEPPKAHEAMSWRFITTERMIRQVHRGLA